MLQVIYLKADEVATLIANLEKINKTAK